ncbi:FCG2A protein, partial [Ploceus nigricollis]|nr:FCG2A protein [Ploceus nigricollis]
SGWCPLSPAGAQTTQLLVEPPWRPAVLWDRVTLTCQGLGPPDATIWYKDGQRWWPGREPWLISESGTYTRNTSDAGLSSPMHVVNGESPVLQVPAQALLEGDTVTLCYRV